MSAPEQGISLSSPTRKPAYVSAATIMMFSGEQFDEYSDLLTAYCHYGMSGYRDRHLYPGKGQRDFRSQRQDVRRGAGHRQAKAKRIRRVNWGRGLFRLWVILSGLWIAVLSTIF